MPKLQAPFPYFGGKSRIAEAVWERFGDTPNYVEPFFGSGAVLLGRPHWSKVKGGWLGATTRAETVNDIDGLLCNFWRALTADPVAVSQYADWPVAECDLTARHLWLVNRRADLTERLMGDPDWYDVKAAGWWVWGLCCWIGSGWGSGKGPWGAVDGKLVHLGDEGRGVNRKLVHLGTLSQGVNSKRGLYEWFDALAARLRRVRVCCGDWERVCGPTPTTRLGLSGVFLDPPYLHAERVKDVYAHDNNVAQAVRAWALAHGDDPLLRIALCGYEASDYEMPASWERMSWTPLGGYASQGDQRGRENRGRERVWFSPHCLPARQKRMELFDVLAEDEEEEEEEEESV